MLGSRTSFSDSWQIALQNVCSVLRTASSMLAHPVILLSGMSSSETEYIFFPKYFKIDFGFKATVGKTETIGKCGVAVSTIIL